jgi:hypothetical protein
MSFIDTFRHQLCGYLAGVPLYLPGEDITGEFDASPDDLVLGGGSGELAGAVVDVVAAIGHVVDDYIEDAECPCDRSARRCADCGGRGFDPDHGLGRQLLDIAREHDIADKDVLDRVYQLSDTITGDELGLRRCVDFSDWSGDTWFHLITYASQPSTGVGTSYSPTLHGAIERWLISSVGEYALVSLRPSSVDATLANDPFAAALFDTIRAWASHQPLFANVAQYPTGYQTGGRGDRLGQPNMRH